MLSYWVYMHIPHFTSPRSTSSPLSHMTKTEQEEPSKSAASIYIELSVFFWRQEVIKRLMYTEYVPNTAFSLVWFLKSTKISSEGYCWQSVWPNRQAIAWNSHFSLMIMQVCACSTGWQQIQNFILRELVFWKKTRQTWEDAEEQRWHLALASTPH